ncbi:hypothetical protein PMIN07_011401 [Paraphaeosphaeria minitans]
MAGVALLGRRADRFRRGGGLDAPPEVILSWPTPNYVNPERHSDSGPITVIVFLVLSILVYFARMWARVVMTKTAGLDDWIMTSSIKSLIAAAIAVVLACREYGFQWHIWDQTSETLIAARKIILVIEVLYLLTTSLIKISILCFYKRITNGSISKTFIYWIWGSIAFVIVYFFAFSLSIIFTCSPIEGFWHYFDINWRLSHQLKCNDEGALIVVVVVISTLQDFFLCALPVILIWNLQISRRRKAALCGIFGLGLLTCVCGVMRAYYAVSVYFTTYDVTWYAWYGWVWTALEAQLGVICACAPALKGFFMRYFNFSTVRSNTYGYGTRGQNLSGRATGYGKLSVGNSLSTSSHAEQPVPLNRIKVSITTNIVEDRDDTVSVESTESTRHLTALPTTTLPLPIHHSERVTSPAIWNGNRTVITAYREEHEIDIEKNIRDA